MNLIIVNNHLEQLVQLGEMLSNIYADCHVIPFVDPLPAIQYILNHPVDAVFAEGSMKCVDGIELREIVHKSKPALRVAITDVDDSENLSAQDIIIVRPITEEKIVIAMTR